MLLFPALLRLHLASKSTTSAAESGQHCRCKGVWGKCADRQLWPAGSAGKLQLQLIDTASNTGAVKPLATATVDLDMRRWKDSQTYQAEVPLVADGVLPATVYGIIQPLRAYNHCWVCLLQPYHTTADARVQRCTHVSQCQDFCTAIFLASQHNTSVPLRLA